jgi:hypothetical protein
MTRRLSLLLLAVVLTAASLFVAPKSAKAGNVYVALKITYYSDATHTVVVGVCQQTCRQFDLGIDNCTGTTSAYGVGSDYTYCPPPE